MSIEAQEIAAHLPKRQLIGLSQKLVDMIRIWKVFGRVISVEEEQISLTPHNKAEEVIVAAVVPSFYNRLLGAYFPAETEKLTCPWHLDPFIGPER